MHCAVDVAPIRAEPRDDAEQVTQALRREPVDVVDRIGGWLHVITAYGYQGWIREDALAAGPGAIVADRDGTPLDVARTYLGTPYLWGGMSELGIDCSGLIHMSYRRIGRLVPRDADEQEEAGSEISEAQPGDLVTYGDESADHIAFWLGDGRILHSTGRDGGIGVVEEQEPDWLRQRRRRVVRL